jgi:chemotaxis protein CheY-P-specific phosphatase CheC
MKAQIKLDKENIERLYEIYSWKIDVSSLQFIVSEKDSKEGVSGVITIIMEGNDMDLFKRLLHGGRRMGIYDEMDRIIESSRKE